MRSEQGVGMVVTERPSIPGKGVLTELAGFGVRTNVDQDTEEGIGAAQGVLVVWSESFAPLLVEMLGEIACWLEVTTAMEVPGRAAG
jgi:hypothetical protein